MSRAEVTAAPSTTHPSPPRSSPDALTMPPSAVTHGPKAPSAIAAQAPKATNTDGVARPERGVSSVAAGESVGCPHAAQKLAPSVSASPQLVQNATERAFRIAGPRATPTGRPELAEGAYTRTGST